MTRGLSGESPANVQNYLKGQHYPASKQELLHTARTNHTPSEVLDVIQELPDEQFGGPQDVMKGYGELH